MSGEIEISPETAAWEREHGITVEAAKASHDLLRHFGEDRKPIQRLGQGVHNGVFYYGCTTTKGEIAVVTSDRRHFVRWTEWVPKEKSDKLEKIVHDDIRDVFGLNYQHDFNDDAVEYPWKQKAICAFLKGDAEPGDIGEIYKSIRSANEEYIAHEDMRSHMFVACYTIASYCFTLFDSFGRLFFNAEKGSGKSKQSRLNKLMGFNAMWATKGTDSSATRDIEATCGWLIVDNYDKLPDELKKAVDHMIETGLYPDARYRKTDKDTMKTQSFMTYSPMSINNILGLDDNTVDKTLEIKMLKTETAARKKHPDTKSPLWEQIRNRCRVWTLCNWKAVRGVYSSLDIDGMDGRFLDVVKGALAIAKVIGPEVYSELLAFCREKERESAIVTLDGDWKYILCLDMKDQAQGKDVWLSLKETSQRITGEIKPIRQYTNHDGVPCYDEADQKRKQTEVSRWVGKTLRNIACFRKTRIRRGETQFFIRNADLLRYMKLQHYDDTPDDSGSSETGKSQHHTPPTPPTPPTGPLDTIKVVASGGVGGVGGEGGEGGEAVQKSGDQIPRRKSNMFAEFEGKTINFIHGACPHACAYCYVPHTRARNLYTGAPRLNEAAFTTPLGHDKKWFVCDCQDIGAAEDGDISRILNRLCEFPTNEYLLLTKNPGAFGRHKHELPANAILGTTLESNRPYQGTRAPQPGERAAALSAIEWPRKMVSIEPIMDFDLDAFVSMVQAIRPEFVYVGADSKNHNLQAPPPEKIGALISRLESFTRVKRKGNLERIYPPAGSGPGLKDQVVSYINAHPDATTKDLWNLLGSPRTADGEPDMGGAELVLERLKTDGLIFQPTPTTWRLP